MKYRVSLHVCAYKLTCANKIDDLSNQQHYCHGKTVQPLPILWKRECAILSITVVVATRIRQNHMCVCVCVCFGSIAKLRKNWKIEISMYSMAFWLPHHTFNSTHRDKNGSVESTVSVSNNNNTNNIWCIETQQFVRWASQPVKRIKKTHTHRSTLTQHLERVAKT